ncbi:MAG: Anaphase-promoting complex subunit 1 [Candelina mexicana]|nr:MAG: Anaphase-promoting complex subunit 1 [Candelina mexicana]
MASVTSLGIHRPSAIPYLVAESILSPEPCEDRYKWSTVNNGDLGAPGEEELVTTESCVVWSQGGIVRRVFRFDVEGEKVQQAVFTWFPTDKLRQGPDRVDTTAFKNGTPDHGSFFRSTAVRPSKTAQELPQVHLHGHGGAHSDGNLGSSNSPQTYSSRSRALVVFLKTQAHVYFVAGTSHILNLPFEVDRVFPAPQGLIIQRRLPRKTSSIPTPVLPSVPQNSFHSSQPQLWSAPSSQATNIPASLGSLPKLQSPPTGLSGGLNIPYNQDPVPNLPRLFSLTDPLVEMGLVVEVPSAGRCNLSASQSSSLTNSKSLSRAEETIFICGPNDLIDFGPAEAGGASIGLALTRNYETGMFTVWEVGYLEQDNVSLAPKRSKASTNGTSSRRRSSYGPGLGTGANTPLGNGLRESFGVGSRMQHVLGPLNSNLVSSQKDGSDVDERDDLASQLDPEFENPAVPAKQSRRVSSLLARADLSTSHDRLAFSDIIGGHNGLSTGGGNKRGESFGGYSSRGSFGAHVSISHRGSMPGNASQTSLGTGSLSDAPVDELLEELNASGNFEGSGGMGLQGAIAGLRKEVAMIKLHDYPIDKFNNRDPLRHDAGGTTKLAVFTLVPPSTSPSHAEGSDGQRVVMCILNRDEKTLLSLIFQTDISRETQKHPLPASRQQDRHARIGIGAHKLSIIDVKRELGIIDATKLTDGDLTRVLALKETKDGRGELLIQAPWTASMKISLPHPLAVYDVHSINQAFSPSRKRDGGLGRILERPPPALLGLEHSAIGGKVDVLDNQGIRHRIRVKMSPNNELIATVLDICRLVLPGTDRGGDGVLLGWWEACQWLQERPEVHANQEWTALTVIVFSMAVGFIEDKQTRTPVKQRKGKAALLRSSSGASLDLESWTAMLDQEGGPAGSLPVWIKGPGWKWIVKEEEGSSKDQSPGAQGPRSSRISANMRFPAPQICRKNPFLINCSALAREFLKSMPGRAASGKQGYLPTAASKDYEVRRTALATILVALHLLQEEMRLDITKNNKAGAGVLGLTPLLAQLGAWLGWESWSWKESGYYSADDVEIDRWLFEDSTITALSVPQQPFQPPSIYDWIERSLNSHDQPSFLSLLDIVSPRASRTVHKHQISPQPPRRGSLANLTPRTFQLTSLFTRLHGKFQPSDQSIEEMIQEGVSKRILETLPEGVVAPMREAIRRSQADPPTTWADRNLDLIGRDDLSMLISAKDARKELIRGHLAPTHEAMRDIHSICNITQHSETVGPSDGSGEVDRQAITRLIFREDRRFEEASKLVQSMRLTVARCISQPEWSESDLLDAQKELVQTIALRTLATPSGRGLLYYSARVPLLTEKYPVPVFNLSCLMKPSNNTVIADRSAFTEEKVCWAFFHSGVAAGLSIARNARGIDTSWIVFNKPPELNNRHAGFLLGLGLNGHLKAIAKWVAFKYLTPKHTMTSIGLLLGLAVSYLGTMDSLITRLLSVHVTRMLPPGAAELNLSSLTQTTGIMGIGLLYCKTQHRRMSEIMLSEMEHIDYEDASAPADALRDEGYRLAAGFALGLINLGKGRDLKGLHDMHLVERLLSLAVGAKKVNIVHILDKATASATIAIALVFMKSNDEGLARKIDVPDTILQFDYVRPDIFLLRTVARHMIMWDKIQPSQAWIRNHLPYAYRETARLNSIQVLNSGDLHFFNILAGLCFSLGLRFAGSGCIEVRNLLGHYLDQYIRLCRLPAINYDGKLTRSTVRNCQDLVALSAATVMAGTGDLHIFRRLRSMHGWVDSEMPYGSHLASHIAIGVLFFGGGNYTFGTSDLAIASLLCAFYPLFPTSILDNKSHLQAFRHLWVLAAEARCLVARDVETHRPVTVSVAVSLRNGTNRSLTAPCLLPELHEIAVIRSISPEYWSVALDFANNPSHLSAFQRNQAIFVRRRAAYDAHSIVFSATLQALNDTQSSQTGRQIFQWIFTLPVLAGLDEAERALVLPADAGNSMHAGTESTVVDDKLVLEKSSLRSGNRDRLWNLRFLFEWAEKMQDEDGRLRWLGRQVLEGLRAAIWVAAHNEVDD